MVPSDKRNAINKCGCGNESEYMGAKS
jgi:hypothetical protein